MIPASRTKGPGVLGAEGPGYLGPFGRRPDDSEDESSTRAARPRRRIRPRFPQTAPGMVARDGPDTSGTRRTSLHRLGVTMRLRHAIAGSVLAAAVVLGAVPAAQAAPAGESGAAAATCRTSWYDSNTYAAQCSGAASTKFYAWAECNNGDIVFGQTKYANGSQSYAYCAGKGGFSGYGGWVV